LAAYNGAAYLPQQITSIFNQDNVEIKLYISVDYSNDSTEQIVKNLKNQHVNLNILKYGQKFGSAAQNFFRLLRDVDFKDCDYVVLSDQDDIWLKTKLNRAVEQLKKYEADAYSSNVTSFWPNEKTILINKAQPQRPFDYMFESAGPGCTFVLTQKLALELQCFLVKNQELCKRVALHDWFIYAYVRSREHKWIIDDESHMLYRQHNANVVGANVGFQAKLIRFKKLLNGWLFEQAILISEILGYTNALPIKKIKRFNMADRIWLIFNVFKLRRRLRDCFALAFFMLLPSSKN
jgi:rhamnosyltransferase